MGRQARQIRLRFRTYLMILLCTGAINLWAQSEITLVDSFQVEGELIAVDRLNQLYLLTEEDQLWKTDAKGNPQFQFSDNTLGPITEIDVSNPFNILVFYKAYQLAKVLDRTLNPNIEFDFGSLHLFNVESLANGIDNSLWVYDQQEGKIFQLDAKGNILNQSQDLIFLIGNRPDTGQLFFNKNELWLTVDGIGLLKFNAFGQYQRTYRREEKIERVQFIGDRLLFYSNEQWQWLNPLIWEVVQISFPTIGSIAPKAYFNSDYMFVQRQNWVFIYK